MAKVNALNEFISLVKSEGLSRTNRYRVDIPGIGDSRRVSLLCSEAQLPGIAYSTAQLRQYGEQRESPYEKMYENVNLTFLVDTSMSVKKYWDEWMNLIQNPSTRDFNYYKNYTTTIKVTVLDTEDVERYSVKLFEAYPKSISSVSLSYESKDVMKITVGIVYKYWTSLKMDKIEQDTPYSPQLDDPIERVEGFKSIEAPSIRSFITRS